MRQPDTRLLLATANQGKIRELRVLLAGTGVELVSLLDFPLLRMPEETGMTFAENALLKARAAAVEFGGWVLTDDSGLVVEALGGAPGIYSARYAGPGAGDAENNAKLLQALAPVPKALRGAAFVCVLALVSPVGEEFLFEGACRGRIATAPAGVEGFGYDPIFLVEPDYQLSMAQLSLEQKGAVSHRGRALRKFRAWWPAAF
ncbi:MAG: RdgB/HAM1 family non-canonical purine NTP pyrophosphatase [Deltaproteobacteria bacterium]|nr:RdgB/HAM1 family non-canonical purine NTP pyrophosphatase [Deltaproteobacteria bacterium]